MVKPVDAVAVIKGVKMRAKDLVPEPKRPPNAMFKMLDLFRVRDVDGKVMVFTVVTPGGWETAEVMYAYDEKPIFH